MISEWAMNQMQAIKTANAFLRIDRGAEADPVQVVFVQRPEVPSYWIVRYGTAILFPEETAGAKVDGGDYILMIDDATGAVTVSG